MRRRIAGAAAAVAVAAAGGTAFALLRGEGPQRPLPWHDLSAQVGPLHFPRGAFRVFVERAKLDDYLSAVMPGAAPPTPPIDFATHKAVLIALGPRSSTGYDVRIVRVREQGSRVVVYVREDSPTLRDHVVARVTYPFRLITIPKLSKPTSLYFITQ